MMKYFCEHLSRLNCVSVTLDSGDGSLFTHINAQHTSLNATISGRIITLELGANVQELHLEPKNSLVSLRIPTKEVAYRQHNWDFQVPWQARDLGGKTISCRQCGQQLATLGLVKQLPSEYWAELMEFWHCHKPHEEHNHETQKDFAMDPTPERTLVSDTYLKIHSSLIDTCEHINPVKVWKWQIAVDHVTIEPHVFVAAMLRELINSHAIFTFMFESQKPSRKLLVWVINVEATYTLTGRHAQNGLKVYYSTSNFTDLMATKSEIETISLSEEAIEQIELELVRTNALLPDQNKNFLNWSLGFLADSD